MKRLTGVIGRPVSTIVMTTTRTANGTEVYCNAATPARTALFFRMILISSLKNETDYTN